jgi:hypothetical protein
VFNVGIRRITFKFLLIKNNLFLIKICDLNILTIFWLFNFSLEVALLFSIFSQQELPN